MDECKVYEYFHFSSRLGGINGGNPDDQNPDPGDGGQGGGNGGDDGGDDGGQTENPYSVYFNTPVEPTVYTADDLYAMTVSAIKALASELGYSLKGTKKADIIEEFLAQQG